VLQIARQQGMPLPDVREAAAPAGEGAACVVRMPVLSGKAPHVSLAPRRGSQWFG
jgi:hypothetical protein